MQGLIKQIGLIFISIIILAGSHLFAQDTDSVDTFADGNLLRFGYSASSNIKYQQYKSNRFLSVENLYNLNKWTSSKTIYQLNDLPVNLTILNFNSIDLIPVNYLTNYKHDNSSETSYSVDDQTILIDSKPIPDNFTILFNGYFGSQTGDPLMNIFVDTNTTLHNVNKIPASGTLSISNRNRKIGYRITAGYYGSFSTGGENDDIISSINHYYFGKLNKQILLSGQTFYNFDNGEILEVRIKFMSYYGWDISPFTTSYIHFENYFHRAQLSLKNVFDNLNLYFKKDGTYTKISEGEGVLPSQFEQSEYSLLGRWISPTWGSSQLQINGDLNYYEWQNISEDNIEQNFFSHEDNFFNYLLSTTYSYRFTNDFYSRLNASYQYQNSYKMISGKIEFEKNFLRNNSLKLSFSSNANAPNVSELYGSYQRKAVMSEGQDEKTFLVKGNSELAYMRSNKISIEFLHRALNNSLQIVLQPFTESIENSIEQETISSVKLWHTGEILRDAEYLNVDRDIIYGTYFSVNAKIISSLFFTTETQLLSKGEAEYLPTLKNYSQIGYTFPKAGTITASWYYRSKTYWDEYTVKSMDDYYKNSGFDGVLPETSVVSLFYALTLKSFYVFKSLHLKIIFENVFDRTQKYIPIGNSINRAFIFEVAGEI